MNNDIKDGAKKLSTAFTQTEEYKKLTDAVNKVKADPDSLKLFNDMNKLQTKIMQAQQEGKNLSEDDHKKYDEVNGRIEKNELMKNLLISEQGVYNMLDNIQIMITKPMADLFESLSDNK